MPNPIVIGYTNVTSGSIQIGHSNRLAKPWNISENGVAFIAAWEKFVPNMYDDDGGHNGGNTTIGYGHLIHLGPINGRASEEPFKKGISREDAAILFREDLRPVEVMVAKTVKVPLYQHEYDALVSFAFNARKTAKLLFDLVNTGIYEDVAAFIKQAAVGSPPIKGLLKRRLAEENMFALGVYDAKH